ncbi:winged helix-turn-helix transcriptional regulator [Propionibacteriaceae bacterium Y1923]
MTSPQPPECALPPADVFSSVCGSRDVLQHLTGRWGALTMVALLREDELRFAELGRRVQGISDRMLSQTLGQLERDGFVQRTVRSTIPPHVEYSLTPLGRRVAEPLVALIGLVESELPTVMAAREEFDQRG